LYLKDGLIPTVAEAQMMHRKHQAAKQLIAVTLQRFMRMP
jgi:hypothetical protein